MGRSTTTAPRKAPVARPSGDVVEILWARIRDEEELGTKEPRRQYNGDAGLDLTISRHQQVGPNAKAILPTNISVAIPAGYFGLILARSSTFHNKQLLVHQGLLDSGYRGEVQVIVYNPNTRFVQVMEGDRIAQLLILPIVPVIFEQMEKVADLPPGDRGLLGFGSTGGQADPRLRGAT